jgi:hypothetical protein
VQPFELLNNNIILFAKMKQMEQLIGYEKYFTNMKGNACVGSSLSSDRSLKFPLKKTYYSSTFTIPTIN